MTFDRSDLHPRWWPTWLGLAFFRLLALLPLPWLLVVGRELGQFGYWLLPRRRHIARVNLRLCFPELPAVERERLVRDTFRALGMGVMETVAGWWQPVESFRPRVQLTGEEHLRQALAQGRGAILLGAHFSILDFAGVLCSLYFPYDVVYRAQNNRVVNRFLEFHRRRFAGKAIERNDTRSLLRSLGSNHAVWLAADQDAGRRRGVYAPFFGIPAATHTSVGRLVTLTGAPVLFVSAFRVDGHYRIDIQPPMAGLAGADALTVATRMNQTVEAAVRQHPEQYYWLHRRFKTQAEGRGELYR